MLRVLIDIFRVDGSFQSEPNCDFSDYLPPLTKCLVSSLVTKGFDFSALVCTL